MTKHRFSSPNGALRPAISVPLTLCAFFAAQWLGAWGFGQISSLLLSAWGVTDKSLPYAPAWLQTAIASYGALESAAGAIAACFAVLLCAKFLFRRPLRLHCRHILLGSGIGFALSAAAFAVCMLTGSTRCMAAGSVSIAAECITVIGTFFCALAPEALLGGVFFPLLRGNRWLRIAVFAALNLVMYVLGVYWTAPALLAAAALSAACAALYETKSFWAAAALRCFFSVFAHRLFGFSANGAPSLFFETYPVSRDWLTGGDLGLESGWLCAALFLLAAVLIIRRRKTVPTEE